MRTSLALLSSRGFIAALIVLILNDMVLKRVAGGLVTGKLSDFAGLFAFPLFWTALMPRHRALIHWATAVVFIWWKLPLSAAWIDAWNARAAIPIGRVEDPTDVIALAAIVASYVFSAAPRRQVPVPALRWAVIPVALFAFAATTFLSIQHYDRTYTFRTDTAGFMRGLETLGMRDGTQTDTVQAGAEPGPGVLLIRIPGDHVAALGARLRVEPDSVGVAVTLKEIYYGAPPARLDSINLIDFFEKCFVQRMDSLLTSGSAMRPTTVQLPPGARQRFAECRR